VTYQLNAGGEIQSLRAFWDFQGVMEALAGSQ